ncbi:MAG: tetratricopeptide repeat protein, partial [Bacteroidota bacterium]
MRIRIALVLACCWLGVMTIRAKEKVKILPAETREASVEILLQDAKENYQRDLDLALAYANLALEKTRDNEELTRIHRAIGFFYENHNLVKDAYQHYELELAYAERSGNKDDIIGAYTDLAIINRHKADYQSCKHFHLKALELAEQLTTTDALEATYHGLGSLYKDIGDYETAISYYLKTIDLTEKRGDIPNAVNTKQYVANTYAESGNTALALSFIKEAYEQTRTLSDSMLLGIVIFDYGKILNIAEQYDEALPKLQESLNIFTYLGHKPLMSRSLFYIADTYAKEGMYKVAEEYFTECLQYESYLSMRSYVDLQYKIGQLNWNTKQLHKAEKAYQKSLEVANEGEYADFIQKNNYGLYEVYNARAQFEEAVGYLHVANRLQDSIRNQEKAKKIVELQFKYDVEKGEREIQALELRQNQLLLLSSSVFFSLLILFFAVYARQQRKGNMKLKQKNDEIQKQNIKLRESNAVLQQFTYVAAHDLKEPLRSIGSFVNLLQMRYGRQFDERAEEYMLFVTNSVKRMNNLLSDLLEYSTISIQKPTSEQIQVSKILDDVVDNLSDKVIKTAATVDYPDDLPSLQMNPLHITQLFQNLISNAIKFTNRQPHVIISGAMGIQETVFTIQDNGIGMEEDHA